MKRKLWPLAALATLCLGFAACNDTGTTSNANSANSNLPGTRTAVTPAPTASATPKYSEEQAKQERARAKENKETVGDTLEDAWIHTKIVTQLIGDSQTPERKINVDVVNNEVTLRGAVDTPEAKAEAERIAKGTEGVKKVTNQLKVTTTAKPAKAKTT